MARKPADPTTKKEYEALYKKRKAIARRFYDSRLNAYSRRIVS